MKRLFQDAVALVAGVVALGVASPSPPTPHPSVSAPAVSAAEADAMKAAIDFQLATSGYGKLCIDGPDSFPAIVYSDDEDPALQTQVKDLLDIGFIRVVSTQTLANRVSATQYELTKLGQQNYTSYLRLGFGGDYHGWCFAEYRVGRIVTSESGPFCRKPRQLLRGFAEPDSRAACETIVTYLPHVISTAEWMRLPQAKEFPVIAGFNSFSQTPVSASLVFEGYGWRARSSLSETDSAQ